jgi:CRISPR/Cas system-associated exonuclease Cas4 (RecB family)
VSRHWSYDLADKIHERQDAYYDAKQQPKRDASSNRASELGHQCIRYLVLLRTHGHRKKRYGRRLQALFERGKENEPRTKAILTELGFNFWGGDQVSWPDNAHQITGHVDAIYVRGDEAIVPELKRVNEYTFNRLNAVEDFAADPDAYFYKWYTQLTVYLYLAQHSRFKVDHGLFLLTCATDGWIKAIPAPLNWTLAELLVDKADAVNRHLETGSDAPYCANRAVCKKCPFFGDVCTPPQDFGEGIDVVAEPWAVERFELLAKLEREGREFVALDKWARSYVKDRTRDRVKPGELLIGPVLIRVTPTPTATGLSQRLTFTFPEEE